jgi:hypothetical protein
MIIDIERYKKPIFSKPQSKQRARQVYYVFIQEIIFLYWPQLQYCTAKNSFSLDFILLTAILRVPFLFYHLKLFHFLVMFFKYKYQRFCHNILISSDSRSHTVTGSQSNRWWKCYSIQYLCLHLRFNNKKYFSFLVETAFHKPNLNDFYSVNYSGGNWLNFFNPIFKPYLNCWSWLRNVTKLPRKSFF